VTRERRRDRRYECLAKKRAAFSKRVKSVAPTSSVITHHHTHNAFDAHRQQHGSSRDGRIRRPRGQPGRTWPGANMRAGDQLRCLQREECDNFKSARSRTGSNVDEREGSDRPLPFRRAVTTSLSVTDLTRFEKIARPFFASIRIDDHGALSRVTRTATLRRSTCFDHWYRRGNEVRDCLVSSECHGPALLFGSEPPAAHRCNELRPRRSARPQQHRSPHVLLLTVRW